MQAPIAIDRYFQRDDQVLGDCFTEDAEVTDDGRTHRGLDEIRAWRAQVSTEFEYTVEVLSVDREPQGRYHVVTNVEGNFPGSPVRLGHDFTLRDDLIERLVIAP